MASSYFLNPAAATELLSVLNNFKVPPQTLHIPFADTADVVRLLEEPQLARALMSKIYNLDSTSTTSSDCKLCVSEKIAPETLKAEWKTVFPDLRYHNREPDYVDSWFVHLWTLSKATTAIATTSVAIATTVTTAATTTTTAPTSLGATAPVATTTTTTAPATSTTMPATTTTTTTAVPAIPATTVTAAKTTAAAASAAASVTTMKIATAPLSRLVTGEDQVLPKLQSVDCLYKVYTTIVKLGIHRVVTDIMAKSLRHDCAALMEEILARRTFLDASVIPLRNLLNNFLFAMLSQEKLVDFQFDCDYLSLICHSIRHTNFVLKDDYIHLRNEHKKRTHSLIMTQKQHIKLCVSIVNIAYAVARREVTVFLPKDAIEKLGLQVQTTQIELNP